LLLLQPASQGDWLPVWKTNWVILEIFEIFLQVLACHDEIDISCFHPVACFCGHFVDQFFAPGCANTENSGLLSGQYVDSGHLSPFKQSSAKSSEDDRESTRPELARYFSFNPLSLRSFLCKIEKGDADPLFRTARI
jgi:hypothetical protein